MQSLKTTLQDKKDLDWNTINFEDLLHMEVAKLGIRQKQYMTVLRYVLTGMKVRD